MFPDPGNSQSHKKSYFLCTGNNPSQVTIQEESKRVTSYTFQKVKNYCSSVGVRNYISSMATARSTKLADPKDKKTYLYSKDE